MDYLLERVGQNNSVDVPTLEFVNPKIKQQPLGAISSTVSPWRDYVKREKFEAHEVDFYAIHQGLQQDGYIRTAVSKYINSIFLRGYNIHSLRPAIEKYLQTRLQMIVDASPDHNHLDDFLQAMVHDLVAYANVYVVKNRRKQNTLPKGITIKGVPRIKPKGKPEDKPALENRDPIVAYELLHPCTVHAVRDKHGNMLRFEQWPWGAKDRPSDSKKRAEFKPEEIIHIVVDREDGFPYGTPFLAAVIDDIRMLRTLEDHVSRLTFRYAFPFTQVKVGEAKPGFQASEEDLAYYTKLVAGAPPDATLTTSEKVSFNMVGAEGKALDMTGYLEHFKGRTFAGLGVGSVSMGEGDTGTRATADAMSTEMHDQIKHFQNVLARNVNQEIFRELLLEGGFDLYADINKNWAQLIFEEIEVEAKIKRESHYLSLLQAGAISFTEWRKETGRQPYTDKDWDDTYLYRWLLPQDMMKKTGVVDLDAHHKLVLDMHKADLAGKKADVKSAELDHDMHPHLKKGVQLDNKLKQKELDAPPDQAAAAGAHKTVTTGQTVKTIPGGGRSVSTTKTVKAPVTAPKGHFNQPGPTGGTKTTAKGTDNKNRPANQHGKRSGPKRKTESSATVESLTARGVDVKTRVSRFEADLRALWRDLESAAIEQAEMHRTHGGEEPELVELLFKMTKSRVASMSRRFLTPAVELGVTRLQEDASIPVVGIEVELGPVTDYNERTIKRLIGDVSRPTLRVIKRATEETDLHNEIETIFAAVEFRLSLIANSEIPQAFWFGYASAALYHQIDLELVREDDACEECAAAPVFENPSSARKRLAAVPCIHPNCECGLRPVPDADPQSG